jgi:hypothetical protein
MAPATKAKKEAPKPQDIGAGAPELPNAQDQLAAVLAEFITQSQAQQGMMGEQMEAQQAAQNESQETTRAMVDAVRRLLERTISHDEKDIPAVQPAEPPQYHSDQIYVCDVRRGKKSAIYGFQDRWLKRIGTDFQFYYPTGSRDDSPKTANLERSLQITTQKTLESMTPAERIMYIARNALAIDINPVDSTPDQVNDAIRAAETRQGAHGSAFISAPIMGGDDTSPGLVGNVGTGLGIATGASEEWRSQEQT